MSSSDIKKWDIAAKFFDNLCGGTGNRFSRYKRELFSKCKGKVMLVAAGTGLDFPYFPEGLNITAIDFSPAMIERARKKSPHYKGKLNLIQADVTELSFLEETFDTVITACTFCSVSNPVKGLLEIHRVLKNDGRLLMFEHVRPNNFLLGSATDLITPISRLFACNFNRRTADHVRSAGFEITSEFNIFLDMMKLFEAQKRGRRTGKTKELCRVA